MFPRWGWVVVEVPVTVGCLVLTQTRIQPLNGGVLGVWDVEVIEVEQSPLLHTPE